MLVMHHNISLYSSLFPFQYLCISLHDNHFGKEEAENPSWNIHDLASHLDEMRELLERIKGDYEPQNTIMYEL